MSCVTPQQSVTITSDFSDRKLKLSGKERCLLLHIWQQIPNKQLLGQEVFKLIFRRKPSLLVLYKIDPETLTKKQDSLFPGTIPPKPPQQRCHSQSSFNFRPKIRHNNNSSPKLTPKSRGRPSASLFRKSTDANSMDPTINSSLSQLCVTSPLTEAEETMVELLVQDPIFLKHTKAFALFVDVLVRSLALEGRHMVDMTREVGRKHAYFKNVNFDAANWLIFKSALLDCLMVHSQKHCKAFYLWNLMFTFVIAEMKDSFYNEIRKKSSNSNLSLLANYTDEEATLFEELERKYEQTISDEEYENEALL